MIWSIFFGYLISTLLISISLSFEPNPIISGNHKLLLKPFKIVIPRDDLTYLQPYPESLAYNLGRQRINDYVKARLADHPNEYGESKEDGESEGSYEEDENEEDLDEINNTNNKNSNKNDLYQQRHNHNGKDVRQVNKKRSSVMLNRLGFVLHKAAHKVNAPRMEKSTRSDDIGGGPKFTDKSGTKDNMLKCFFNGVSCF
ncbi:uncharacterized protein LOC107368173 [Tetranychus urticae]|uniref:Uncharacterized protein n=1 Tax=Tetranychus urticae TaxID=32264 RepID=A0A158P5F1_TETUR|nr:uncharacterized protein LOC107368173 [Tetranychus urticae]